MFFLNVLPYLKGMCDEWVKEKVIYEHTCFALMCLIFMHHIKYVADV